LSFSCPFWSFSGPFLVLSVLSMSFLSFQS
jgi:hypothetical protein